MTIKKIILLVIFILIFGIQFIRPERNNGEVNSSNDISQLVNVPNNIKLILNTACFDCHSNHTNYKWYFNIQPLGWWLQNHINEGKRHLNFSEFSLYNTKRRDHKLEETAEEVAEHKMPLNSYTWIHPEAKLNDEQIKALVDWVQTARKEISQK